jgi:tol-pal system protein YbgF
MKNKNSVLALFFTIGLASCALSMYSDIACAEQSEMAAVEDRNVLSDDLIDKPSIKADPQKEGTMWLIEEENGLKPIPVTLDTPAAKIDHLQEQVQALQGKLELQEHHMQQLTKQISDNYQDLDSRLKTLAAAQQAAQTSKTPPTDALANTGLSEVSAPTTPAAPVIAPTSVAAPTSAEDEKALYQQAYKLAQDKKYDLSIDAFKRLIKTYPKSTYVPTAYFWMGEMYIVQSKYDEAVDSFNQIILNHPKSPKISEAVFKIGYIAYARGNNKLAAKKFNEVKSHYPGTSAAKQADQYLKKLAAKKA